MLISAQVKLTGNNTNKESNTSITIFSFVIIFNINIHPGKSLTTMDTLWTPPPLGWIKYNIDGLNTGSPAVSSRGDIFRDYNACHFGSFCDFIGFGRGDIAEFKAAMLAIKKAKDIN